MSFVDAEKSAAATLRIMAARILAQARWPYVSTLLYSLKLVESDPAEISTMAVDTGWRLYYSADFVMSESAEALATVLLHECMHCMLEHGRRFEALPVVDKNHNIWNYAGDCAINQVLDDAHMQWTEVTPVRYVNIEEQGVNRNMSTEVAYSTMVEYQKNNPEATKENDCGSVSGGKRRTYELDVEDSDSPAADINQQNNVLDSVASAILKVENDGGDVPEALSRIARDRLDPQLDWKKLLAFNIRSAISNVAGRRDYTYSRPSRRQGSANTPETKFIFPAMRQPQPPCVGIVLDTSGSIGNDTLDLYLSEIRGIFTAVGVSSGLWVLPCDSKVHEVAKIKSFDLTKLRIKGGGGTDMSVGIYEALKIRPRVNIVVILTDGATPWPERKPVGSILYLAVLTSKSYEKFVPEWMTSIVMDQFAS
jgi:predicted metal-dependent peptidase